MFTFTTSPARSILKYPPLAIQLWQIDKELTDIETDLIAIEATLDAQLVTLDQIDADLGTGFP